MRRASRRPRIDPRRAKIHYCYTVAEVASLFGVHRNTVRYWTRNGLQTIRVGHTTLILGDELRAYLTRRRAKRRVRCPPGSMYCLRCKEARRPPDGLVEAGSSTPTTVNLRGLCPDCGSLMHRRASLRRLAESGFDQVVAHAGAATPSR
jgi:excisionase family DNA binding protein